MTPDASDDDYVPAISVPTRSELDNEITAILGGRSLTAATTREVVEALLGRYPVMTGDVQVAMALTPSTGTPPATGDAGMIDAIVGMADAGVIELKLSNNPAKYMSKYLVLDKSSKYAGVNVATGSAGPGFAGIEDRDRPLRRLAGT